MNSIQIGRVARALRHRLALRQADIAERVGLGHDLVSRVERGRIDGLTLRTLRTLFEGFDAEVVITIRWRGGELDRIVDRRHAALASAVVARLQRLGWVVEPEVSFLEFGERGSIDLLAWHAETRTLLVVEIKTELTSVEETIRRHDVKARLGAKVGEGRFGGRPALVARLLVLPDERTPRRHVERFAGVLQRAYPARGRAVRMWLAAPAGPLAGLLFLSSADTARLRQRVGPVRRIRGHASAHASAETPSLSHRVGE